MDSEINAVRRGPVNGVVTRPDGRRIHGDWLPETGRIRFVIAFGAIGERLGEFMLSAGPRRSRLCSTNSMTSLSGGSRP